MTEASRKTENFYGKNYNVCYILYSYIKYYILYTQRSRNLILFTFEVLKFASFKFFENILDFPKFYS